MTQEKKIEDSCSKSDWDADREAICSGCTNAHACRDVWSADSRGGLSPVGISLGSGVAFLLPILFAVIAGAIVKDAVGESDRSFLWQGIAVIGGLVIGVGLAWVLMRVIRKRYNVTSQENRSGN